ncbi:MAG TPA: aldolase/citrate lyase family protein [Casimicrobiaceae bacterium]|jgi:4-hydroxy-2-oxoheptanedioate aldolase|nr:aldolase/citrate lyase family protein [Casimicrobiaceae bacterium]
MSQDAHPLRAKLAAGRTLAGIWSLIPSAPLVGALAASGFDFVILDAEHGAWDFATLDGAITACEDGGASPLVRAPGADAFFIQRALDLGADGVVVPQVADAEAATRAIAMMHFAPRGTRGYNPFTRGGRYGIAPQPKLADGYPFSCVMVESPTAALHLERIVEHASLDFVYLGIYDYSVAIGIPGQVEDPRVQSFIERSARIVRGAGKAIGTTAMNRIQTARLVGQGVNVLLYGTDTWAIGRAAKEGLDLYASAGRR